MMKPSTAMVLALAAVLTAPGAPARATTASPAATRPACPFTFPDGRRSVDLPITPGADLILVPVSIDGHDAYLAVDTTGYTMIDSVMAKEWGLPVIQMNPFPKPNVAGRPDGFGGGSTAGVREDPARRDDPAAAAAAAAQPAPVYRANRLSLGGCTVSDYPLVGREFTPSTFNGRRLAGVLGLDALGQVPFTLDMRGGTLTLYNPDRFVPPAGATAVDLEPMWIPAVILHANVEGMDGSFVLSTTWSRAPVTLSASFALHHLMQVTQRPKSFARVFVSHTYHDLYDCHWNSVKLFGRTFTDLPGAYYLTPATADVWDGMIGAAALRDARLTVDLATNRAWVEWHGPESLDALLKRLTDRDRRDFNGAPPLLRAAQLGRADAVKALLDQNAEPNVTNRDGVTPLQAAAEVGDVASVEALLVAGADTERADNLRGFTPLHAAVRCGHRDVVLALIRGHADVNAVSAPGTLSRTPLMLAAETGNADLCRELIDHGADVDRKSATGLTPLDSASSAHSPATVAVLLAHHADPSLTTPIGMPLTFAVGARDPETVRLLLRAGAHADAHGADGLTPLAHAVDHTDEACARALLSGGADPREPMPDGTTALDHALRKGDPRLIRLLLVPPPVKAEDAPAQPSTRPHRRVRTPSDVSMAD